MTNKIVTIPLFSNNRSTIAFSIINCTRYILISNLGLSNKAQAIPILCFCPPDSETLVTRVSKPFGNSSKGWLRIQQLIHSILRTARINPKVYYQMICQIETHFEVLRASISIYIFCIPERKLHLLLAYTSPNRSTKVDLRKTAHNCHKLTSPILQEIRYGR